MTGVHGVSFFVPGIAQPKGSTVSRAFQTASGKLHVATRSANPRVKDWQHQVAAIAAQRGVQPFLGPVSIAVTFYLPRPKSLPKKVAAHTKKPDLDKLLRALNDGLTGIAYVDDSQVVQITAAKHYGAERVGAEVYVSEALQAIGVQG